MMPEVVSGPRCPIHSWPGSVPRCSIQAEIGLRALTGSGMSRAWSPLPCRWMVPVRVVMAMSSRVAGSPPGHFSRWIIPHVPQFQGRTL